VWSFVLSGTYGPSAMLGTGTGTGTGGGAGAVAFFICSSWIRPTGLFAFTITF
jgi:hypothetical protein